MSLDINFNKTITLSEIEDKTTLKVVEVSGNLYLEDQYGNVVAAKGTPLYGITLYGGPRNPIKILDELVNAFDIMFIDDESIDKYNYEPKKYDDVDLYTSTMVEYGYLLKRGGGIVITERDENEYVPYDKKVIIPKPESDLPF